VEGKAMDELLTISEIESRFPDEWVLVQDPQTNEKLKVLGGRVVCHSPNREDIDRALLERKPPRRFAVFFNRTEPDDRVYVL
jgi:hypothetical protein